MKGKTLAIVQLILSIIVIVLFKLFFFKVLGKFGINFTGTAYEIALAGRYLITSIIVFIIYYKDLKSTRHSHKKNLVNTLINSFAFFFVAILLTIGLHQLINYVGKSAGITLPYSIYFTNYFVQKFSLGFIINLTIEVLFVPFLLCVIFPLGFSKVFKKVVTASLLSGLCYGILYGILLNTSFMNALIYSLTPACVIALLTFLYKSNQNITSVILSYICYILVGIFAINLLV